MNHPLNFISETSGLQSDPTENRVSSYLEGTNVKGANLLCFAIRCVTKL